MSISTSTTYNNPMLAADETDPILSYPFKITNQDQLKVTLVRVGIETVLVHGTNYTLDGIGNSTGGNVLLDGDFLEDDVFVIEPVMPLLQSNTFTYMKGFSRTKIEGALDYIVGITKRLLNLSRRSIKLPVGDIATDVVLPIASARAGKYLHFNATTGLPEVSDGSDVGQAAISLAVQKTVTTAANVDAFRVNIGTVGYGCRIEVDAWIEGIGYSHYSLFMAKRLTGGYSCTQKELMEDIEASGEKFVVSVSSLSGGITFQIDKTGLLATRVCFLRCVCRTYDDDNQISVTAL